MSILSDYRAKRKAVRAILNEIREVAAAPDLAFNVKAMLIRGVHQDKIIPGLDDLGLVVHDFRSISFTNEQQMRTYLTWLDQTLVHDPVDPSQGHH